ncbi:MAG: hypothetical protein R3F19_11290 [Verrucomicrobiales bacterium]
MALALWHSVCNGTILTSVDGVTWTKRTLRVTESLIGGNWSGTRLIVVGVGRRILTSTDGINW